MNRAAPAEAYRLAFEEARRGLEDQERAVGELRARAGALIAGAAITTSFFGTQAIRNGDPSEWAWMAIGAFVLVSLAVLAVLWPRRDWEFDLGPAEFIASYLEPDQKPALEMPAIHRDLALHMGGSATRNRRQLRALMIIFRAGAVLLTLEVLAWIGALVDTT